MAMKIHCVSSRSSSVTLSLEPCLKSYQRFVGFVKACQTKSPKIINPHKLGSIEIRHFSYVLILEFSAIITDSQVRIDVLYQSEFTRL